MNPFKQYRIGKFAKNLGVTQAFLKHYEAAGLLDSHQHENGYRYYSFNQSPRVFEYRRLQSYGVPIKDMREAVTATEDEAFDFIDKRADELQKTADRLQAIIDEHRRIHAWHEAMQGKKEMWEIRQTETKYFLPHTRSEDFLDDDRIYEILPNWCDRMPVTKSALLVMKKTENDSESPVSWGMCVAESNVEKMGICLNNVVRKIPATQAFIYHFSGLENAFSMSALSSDSHPAMVKLRELGLQPASDTFEALLINEMKLETETEYTGFGSIIIPLKQ